MKCVATNGGMQVYHDITNKSNHVESNIRLNQDACAYATEMPLPYYIVTSVTS